MLTVIAAVAILAIGAPEFSTQVTAIKAPVSETLNKRDQEIVTRLHAFILTKQKRSKSYARQLAERIVVEAKRNKLPVAVFAAIAWNESWFWWKTSGTSHEYGVWQIWPYSDAVAQEWDALRKQGRIGSFANKPWKSLGYKLRRGILGDIDVATALAARILRRLVKWCKAKHRVHKKKLLGSRRHHRWMDRYGHYNSGTAWPKPVYYYQLRRHTRVLQRVFATSLKH